MTDPNRNEKSQDRLSRRTFLRGAAIAVGASALSFSPSLRAESATSGAAILAFTLSHWDGSQFIDAARLSSGDPELCTSGAHVAIAGRPAGPRTIHSVSALYRIGSRDEAVPYHAWAASSHGDTHSSPFTMPIKPMRGLELTVTHSSVPGGPRQESLVTLAISNGNDRPKLRSGTYLLTHRQTRISGCALSAPAGHLQHLQVLEAGLPATFEHLLIKIDPA